MDFDRDRMQVQLVSVLTEASEAHHEYEDNVLGGVMDQNALGWYAGYVLGRLGDFATPSELNTWFHETRVRNNVDKAAANVIRHMEEKGQPFSFQTFKRVPLYSWSGATQDFSRAEESAVAAYGEYAQNTLKGVDDGQREGWIAGYMTGRLQDITVPSQMTQWLKDMPPDLDALQRAGKMLGHLGIVDPVTKMTAAAKAAPATPVIPDPLGALPKLEEALKAIDTLTMPTSLSNHQVEYDGPGYLEARFDKIPTIYGFNTLPGHRANEKVPDEKLVQFQFNLIANHRLGNGPYFDDKTARAITYAKLFAAVSGNTLITKPLYEEMLRAATSPDFKPQIPQHASYSAGDVIPAAHWAQALLDWEKTNEQKDPKLQPGEGMALINGAFVHVGVTLSLIRQLQDFWPLYIDTAEKSFRIVGSDARVLDEPSTQTPRKWFNDTIKHVKDNLKDVKRTAEVQDPVSIRSFSQQVQGAVFAFSNLMQEAENILGRPSGNPIMHTKDGKLEVTPSGSFDQASLAIATGNVVEVLLMLAWNSVRRTVHMLDGEHAGLPKDGVTNDDHLAMIQWPKLAQAELEELRGKYGIHNFVSGSTTSEEIEDFWTNGTETSIKAMDLLKSVERLLMVERLTAERLGKVMSNDNEGAQQISLRDATPERIEREIAQVVKKDIPFPLKM